MCDSLLVLPRTPDGADVATYYADMLRTQLDVAADTTRRLHLEPGAEHRDRAAIASTALRELRQVAREALDREPPEVDELLLLLAAFERAATAADFVLMANDLRVAYEHDADAYDALEVHAIAIAELSLAGFLEFLQRGHAVRKVQRVESRARVPLVHALMRAVGAGVLAAAGDEHPCRDDLVDATARALGRALEAYPVNASTAGRSVVSPFTVVTVHALIALHAELGRMTNADPAVRTERVRADLAPIREDLRFQRRELGDLPDLDTWYRIGCALGVVTPVLEELAREQDVAVPVRANAAQWFDVLVHSEDA